MNWHVYLIRTKTNSLYCGVTTNLERRFLEHQENGAKTAKYLRGKQPLSLAWFFKADDKRQAMKLEWKIKRLTKTQKEQLCHMHRFSKCDLLDFLLSRTDNGKKCNNL